MSSTHSGSTCPDCALPKDTPITHTFCTHCERKRLRPCPRCRDSGCPSCDPGIAPLRNPLATMRAVDEAIRRG